MSAAREIQMPSDEEQERAREALRELSLLKRDRTVHVRSDGDSRPVDVVLPERVFRAVLELLQHTANGNAVTLVPVHAELTTQQAADLLNVSRPHLVKLLEGGAIPFHRAGRHRRVRAEDLFAYRKRRREESEQVFQELADSAQEHDLGY